MVANRVQNDNERILFEDESIYMECQRNEFISMSLSNLLNVMGFEYIQDKCVWIPCHSFLSINRACATIHAILDEWQVKFK